MIRIDNLRLLMQQNGWKQADLCRAIGKSDAYVSKLMNQKSSFGEKTARNIEEKCKKPRGWLDEIHQHANYAEAEPISFLVEEPRPLDLTPATAIVKAATFIDEPLSGRLLPVITWEHIEMLELDNTDPRLKSCAHAPAEGASGLKTKWIIMNDESGGERFPVGARLKIEVDSGAIKPKPGKFVVVKDDKGTYAVRRFVQVSGEHFRAVAANDAFATLDSERDQLKIIGVVVQALIDC